MRKKTFTFNEHVQLAGDLDGMRATLMMHIVRLSECYPKSSRQVKLVRALQKAIDSLRCEMDNVFYREYPSEQYRAPHYEWVHTPYYTPKTVQKCKTEQNDE